MLLGPGKVLEFFVSNRVETLFLMPNQWCQTEGENDVLTVKDQ